MDVPAHFLSTADLNATGLQAETHTSSSLDDISHHHQASQSQTSPGEPVPSPGERFVLLANMTWSALLYVGLLKGRQPLLKLARRQTGYAAVYALWLATVVVVLPPIFDFA